MRAKVYYQDFALNAEKFDIDSLVLDKDKAVFIGDFVSGVNTKEEFAEVLFRELNIGVTVTRDFKFFEDNFNKAEHTSMSIGDYIEFEDGEIWITATVGWKVISQK